MPRIGDHDARTERSRLPECALHNRFAWTAPDPLHGAQERLRLTDGVKLQIDHYVVGVVLRSKNLVAASPGILSVRGIAIERLRPFLEAWDGVMRNASSRLTFFTLILLRAQRRQVTVAYTLLLMATAGPGSCANSTS